MTSENESARVSEYPVGTRRLAIVQVYFNIVGILGTFVTAGIGAAIAFPKLGMTVEPAGHPFLTFVTALFMTVGFFRTANLLGARLKSGAWLAAGCFLLDVTTNIAGVSNGRGSLFISGLGLALVASLWRHFD